MAANASTSRQRQQKIRQLLEKNGEVKTAELTRLFGVTEMTVRRDLRELFEEGAARPVYGGAMSAQRITLELNFDERRRCNLAEKRRIGAAAADMVNEGDTVFLDTGTTTLETAKALASRDCPCLVITASLAVASELWGSRSVRVSLLGGEVREKSPDLVGPIAEWILEKLSARLAILGSEGIDPSRGSFAADMATARIAQRMAANAGKVVVVADHTKIGRNGAAMYAPVSEIDAIITTSRAPKAAVAALRQGGVQVIMVQE